MQKSRKHDNLMGMPSHTKSSKKVRQAVREWQKPSNKNKLSIQNDMSYWEIQSISSIL